MLQRCSVELIIRKFWLLHHRVQGTKFGRNSWPHTGQEGIESIPQHAMYCYIWLPLLRHRWQTSTPMHQMNSNFQVLMETRSNLMLHPGQSSIVVQKWVR